MNLSLALVSIVGLFSSSASGHAHAPGGADKFHATKDFIGNTMWIFGSDGIYVYSPDGKALKNRINAEGICGPKEEYKGPSYHYCRFHDIVSDGKKYVWAAVNRGKPSIDVFDIDTSAVVGSFDTCLNPRSLEYHSLREEVWVRCSEAAVGMESNLDVFSAVNPSGDTQTDILLDARMLTAGVSSHGSTIIDNTLGDVGYITDDNLNKLFKMDLSQKTLINELELFPNSNGLEDAVYSTANKHIYMRSKNCCSCGFTGADLASCGGSPSKPKNGTMMTPATGNHAGQEVEGTCRCSGATGIDTVGVIEYDTVTDTVVANHLMAEGFGGDPFVSPDGKYIVMLGRNAGKTIRILRTQEQGLASSVMIDLELGFKTEGYEGKSVAKWFSFVYRNGKTCVVFPSGTEHKVAIVEIPEVGRMTNENAKIDYVTLTTAEFDNTAPHGMYRRVMWAEDTDYVWVSSNNPSKLFVVDVMKKEVVNEIEGFKVSSMLSVQNYERARQIDLQKQMITDMQDISKPSNTTQIAAIVIGCCALVAALANIAYMAKMKKVFLASQQTMSLMQNGNPVDIEGASDTGLGSVQ